MKNGYQPLSSDVNVITDYTHTHTQHIIITCKHARTHAHKHARTHARKHTRTHVHTDRHTYTQPSLHSRGLLPFEDAGDIRSVLKRDKHGHGAQGMKNKV